MENFLPQLSKIKTNFLSSIVVFLVAIPLCLGIALACGAPLISGIVSGIIGGIVVGLLSQSSLSVSGPAAGMVAIVLAAINQLGSFEAFLLALTLAGVIQIIIGLCRSGFIADFVPSTVIKGLLAAIGIIIIIKQLPLAFGYYAEAHTFQDILKTGEETFSLTPLFSLIKHISVGASLITLISLLTIFTWEKMFNRFSKILPSAVLVVLIAVCLNFIFAAFSPALSLQTSHLVNIPVNESWAQLLAQFKHPNFSSWNDWNIYIYAFTIAVVSSLETLLNIQAVENIDTRHRYVSRNRELLAQGFGNIFSGLFGGLPITSVIVRSSVNIYAGATSKLSTIFHGILLLLSIVFIARGLNYIPIAALAAILIYTGYKLAKISLFVEVYKEGFRYFIPFVITIVSIVFLNLLMGILIGLICSLLFILYDNTKNGFTTVNERRPSGKTLRLILPQQVSFINKAAIIDKLNKIPAKTCVTIDANATEYIDNDILNVIRQFKNTQAADKKILLNLEGFKDHYKISNQTSFISATTYDIQAALTPSTILEILREGNQRFLKNMLIHKNYKQHIAVTSAAQHPMAVVLGCIDSRVPVEMIFDLSLGDIFVVRVAGNIPNEDILGSLEFACKVAGAKLIVVLAHTQCGAIKAACDGITLGHVTQLLDKIKPAIEQIPASQKAKETEDQFLRQVTQNHVEMTKRFIYEKSSLLKELINNKTIGLVDAVYDITSGQVIFNEAVIAQEALFKKAPVEFPTSDLEPSPST